RATRVLEPENGSSWVHLTLARLAERTLFQRTALSSAISDLENDGVVERGQRRGQEGQYRLLPAAFGVPAAPPVVGPAHPVAAARPGQAAQEQAAPLPAGIAPPGPPLARPASHAAPPVHVGGIPVEL